MVILNILSFFLTPIIKLKSFKQAEIKSNNFDLFQDRD